MPDENDDFVDAVREESRLTDPARQQQPAAPVSDGATPPSGRVKTGRSTDHAMGVIIQGADGKDSYAPLYEPNPKGDAERRRLRLRVMDEFGDAELEQIIDNPGLISLFLGEWEGGPVAFQVTNDEMNNHQIIVAQGGMAWEKDPGWERFFKHYQGTPLFSRGGGFRDRDGNEVPSKALEDSALQALRAIRKKYAT